MSVIIKFGTFCLNVLYSFIKLLPVQNKITYISRQMNVEPKDFTLVIDGVNKKTSDFKQVVLAKKIPDGLVGKIGYCFHMLEQMYHIATSRAVVLDTYCIPVSLLKQRESLIVIQMWHALGSFKKFGYSVLDQKEGSSSKIAKLMKMHHNYTYVLTSSDYCAPYFAEAFNVSMDKMRVFPLPKTDLLVDPVLKQQAMDKIFVKYPHLKTTNKKIVVYSPTFRKNDDTPLKEAMLKLIDKLDFDKYELIIKKHPLSTFTIDDERVIDDTSFTSLEFFHLADIIISDYSAVIYEAAMLNTPICFYAFDCEEYMDSRNFYLDYYKDMPGPIVKTAEEMVALFDSGTLDTSRISAFKEQMIASCKKSYTEDFVDFLLKEIDKKCK